MATSLFRTKGSQFFDDDGAPLAGGFIYYYEATTTTLQNTFSDAAGAVPNTNPLELDAYGRLQTSVYLGDSDTYSDYKELLTDANAVTISNWPIDNLPSATPAAAAASSFAYPSVPWETVTSASSPVVMVAGDAGSAYEADTTGGSITFNLPSAVTTGSGKGFFFKKTSASNSMIWHPSGTEEIDGVNADYTVTRGQAVFLLTSNGANWKITTASYKTPPVTRCLVDALVCTNNAATPTTKWDVNADNAILVDTNGEYIVTGTVDITIDASNTGANALDTGTIAAATWYHAWIISNGTTVAGLLSLSATAPTMPTGYTYKYRVGAIRTDGAAATFERVLQKGNAAQYVVVTGSTTPNYPLMSTGTNGNTTTPTYVEVSTSSYVPPTATCIGMSLGANGGTCMVSPNNSTGAYNSTTNPPPIGLGSGTVPVDMVLESSSVYWAAGNASAFLACTGWVDAVNAS